jgi:hypothetical protein
MFPARDMFFTSDEQIPAAVAADIARRNDASEPPATGGPCNPRA